MVIKIRKDYFRKGFYSVHDTGKGYDQTLDYFKKKSDAELFRKRFKKLSKGYFMGGR